MKKPNPFSRQSKGTFAFIDSQNLNLGTQKAGWKLDWQKFLKFLQTEHNVKTAYLFIGYMQEYEEMYKTLHDLGYLIVLKPTVDVSGPDPKPHLRKDKDKQNLKVVEPQKPTIKGNVDAELVLYAMKDMPKYNKAIIVSGDGDFYCLAEYLAEKKKLKHIMTPNWQYSSLLKPYEKYIIRVDQMRQQLEHKDYRRAKKKRD